MVQRCPVCEGRGNVAKGFYEGRANEPVGEREECRACKGVGTFGCMDWWTYPAYVVVPTFPAYPPYPTYPPAYPALPGGGTSW